MKKEFITAQGAFETEHFSQAVRAGNTIYVSGKIARDAQGNIVPGGFEAQAEKAFANMKLTLEAAGASLKDIVKFTVYLRNIDDLDKFREIRDRYFSPPRPASTAVEVSGLVLNAVVEIEAVAVVD